MEFADRSDHGKANLYTRGLTAWVAFVVRHPVACLAIAAVLTAVSVFYSAQTVRMNSDDSALISQDEPFRRDYQAYIDSFPELDETSVVVVTSDSIDLARKAVDRLSAALRQRPDLIATVYAPSADQFFEDHALLYLDEDELEDTIERLAQAQPALAALTADKSLRGLFGQIEDGIGEIEDGREPTGLVRIAELVSDTIESVLAGEPRPVSWSDELLDIDDEVYRLIIVQGRNHFEESISSSRLIAGIRQAVADLGLTPEHGVRVRLTGMVPLAHDEQASLQSGLSTAGVISLALLTAILGFGIRSLRIIAATLVALAVSLSWTTSFAMMSVGEFNVISAAFAVLLIGLSVDFAIHVGLRYEEEVGAGHTVAEALRRTGAGVGGAVSLCALTSAIGFLSFVPTRYQGLADLGTIAAGGMAISLVVSFTVLPAMLALMRPPSRAGGRWTASARWVGGVEKYSLGIVAAAAALAVGAVLLSRDLAFDFSTLGMKDPRSESMVTLREIQEQGIVTDYSAIVLAPDLASSAGLESRLAALDPVAEVRGPTYYVPDAQETKLEMIDDASFFLETVLYPTVKRVRPTRDERMAAIANLRRRIAALSVAGPVDTTRTALRALGSALGRLAVGSDPSSTALQVETLILSDLDARVDWLRRATEVRKVEFEDLPTALRARLVDARGRARVVVLPRGDMRNVDDLTRFVDAVAEVAPRATGRPAVEAGIGRLVVDTFRLAIAIALVTIAVLLLFVLRDATAAAMVLAPITLAALFTVAAGVWIDMPFNMSNVVVIPLVLGLGVDTAIHVVLRFREDGNLAGVMTSSTPRAVLLSALTTLAAFSSLAVSGHAGIRSLGVLLSISVVCLIFTTLVVLPAMLVLRQSAAGRK